MKIKSKSLDEINEITYDTKTGITTTTLVHTINFEKYKKLYGGESEIFKILLEELKKGTFSDCDEEFQYCCYQIISNLQQENQKLKKQLEEWNHHLKCSKEMLDIQGHNGNYNYDSYMLGIYNGMEYIIALFETREPIFKSGKDIEFTSELQQENKQLKDNWNKLKKWLRIKDILANSKINPQSIKFKDLLKHMEYLEKER